MAAERISQFLSEGAAVDYVQRTAAADESSSELLAIDVRSAAFSWEAAPEQILWDPVAAKSVQFGDRKHAKKMQQKAAELAAQRKAAKGPPRAVLKDINLRVAPGSLCCVVGKVGSGKSALLHSILGEMLKLEGTVRVSGSVSYASQSAFILNATVRDNVLFCSEYDQDRYLAVVRGCCLVSDFKLLPDGDATEIGERGVNLSGGQRQRLALARALYRKADVYLLDDPLSAVDAHVGRHIMDFILSWLHEKAVVMPCHQLHFLHHADLIVSLDGTTIREQGSFTDLMAAGGPFAQLMHTQGATGGGEDPPESPRTDEPLDMTPRPDAQNDTEVLVALKGAGKAGGLIAEEDRKKGKISKEVYSFYLKQFSFGQLGPLVAFFALSQLCVFSMDVFLSRWAVGDTTLLLYQADDPTLVYCITYAVLGVCTFIFSGSRYVWCQLIGLKASNKMHTQMLNNLVHAPTSFFDVTPIGR